MKQEILKVKQHVLKYNSMIFTWINTESQITFCFMPPRPYIVLITEK